ncbi:hypothetical protein Desde_1456 [Desulfitobacterium dehalogenans ATCC 51507]|uniref:Uncharacterized protein n=1 Tax=Desulfitobacterium dehalogenans (strain ATCC 51507 / DSM 9161 / JW/IU-DC1) TaxID=756499 RepID=I4A7E1_DESDJ|nr:hypothetical protein [Desulfitobacterium dehalogenans]AFL99875.1 hypothetical protein Desde_1456 [Desulfitobacterium dehalogenans ATCC 51507]
MDFRNITQDEREAIYNEVWTDPVTIVAKRYNMSDNGLRKHCRRLWIPLPPNGYWARVKAGQKVPKPELPKVRGELKRHVSNYFIKFRGDIDQITDAELMSEEELSLLTEETRTLIRETCSQIQVKSQLRNPHDLITKHKEEIAYRKKRDRDLQQASFNSDYHEIVKRKYRDNVGILPIHVSDANINRAYRILDTLIHAIEDMEGYIQVGQDSGKDKANFTVMHSNLCFELKEEKSKKRSSPESTEILPNMELSFLAKSWFDHEFKYSLEYKDKNNEPLEDQVGNIIYDIFAVANKLLALEKMEEREAHRKEEEWKRQRRLEKMRNGELEEVKLLQQAASDWDNAQKIRRFTDAMESIISQVADEKQQAKLVRWLKWARDKADWLDPLTENEDELLGKSRHLFDLINNLD